MDQKTVDRFYDKLEELRQAFDTYCAEHENAPDANDKTETLAGLLDGLIRTLQDN